MTRPTFAAAVALLPYTTGLVAIVSVGLVSVKILRQPSFPHFAALLGWSIAAVVISVLGRSVLRRINRSTPSLGTGAAVSWIVAVQLGVILLVIPMLLLTVSTEVDNIPGWLFPILNKRWLIALYDLSVVTLVVFPVALERLRTESQSELNLQTADRPIVHRRWASSIVGIIIVVAMSWYLAGPPWNLQRLHRGIDWHEQIQRGSLQAISKGYPPYVGPASTVYGPGSQLLTYEVMRLSGRFDIVSFRTAFAICEFAALLAVGVAAYWWLGIVPALGVIVLAFVYSPIAFYYTLTDGTFAGFYGWANPLRYLAPLLVVPSLARLACESPLRRLAVWRAVALGVGWGIGA